MAYAALTYDPSISVFPRPYVATTAPALPHTDSEMNGALPGIDVQAGRGHTKGDDRLYKRMLDMFLDSQRDFIPRFRAVSASGDAAAAMRLAHDLKGLAATIGAHAERCCG